MAIGASCAESTVWSFLPRPPGKIYIILKKNSLRTYKNFCRKSTIYKRNVCYVTDTVKKKRGEGKKMSEDKTAKSINAEFEKKKERKSAKKKNSFAAGLKTEWKKIVWLSKERVGKQVGAVIVISAILAFLMTLIDNGALALVQIIMK